MTFGRARARDVPARSSASRSGAHGSRVVVDAPRRGTLEFDRSRSLGEAAAHRLRRGARRRRGRGAARSRGDAVDARARRRSTRVGGRAAVARCAATSLVLDDTLQRQPGAACAPRSRTLAELARARRRRVAVLGEMQELGAVARARARRARRRGRRRPGSALADRRAAASRIARSTRAAARGRRGRRAPTTPRRRPRGRVERVPPGRRRARQGARAASAPSASSTALARDATEGERRCSTSSSTRSRHDAGWLGWLNVLRYVPFRIIAATHHGDAPLVRRSRLVHPRAPDASRSARSSASDGPETPQDQERHADDGRRAHPALRCSCRRSSGATSRNVVRLADDRGHRRLRRHRLPRRLPQDQAEELARASRAATSCSASSSSAARVLGYAFLANEHVPARLVGHPRRTSASRSSPSPSTRSRCRSGVYVAVRGPRRRLRRRTR